MLKYWTYGNVGQLRGLLFVDKVWCFYLMVERDLPHLLATFSLRQGFHVVDRIYLQDAAMGAIET